MLLQLNGSLNGFYEKVYLGHELEHTFYDFFEEKVLIWEIKSKKSCSSAYIKLNV